MGHCLLRTKCSQGTRYSCHESGVRPLPHEDGAFQIHHSCNATAVARLTSSTAQAVCRGQRFGEHLHASRGSGLPTATDTLPARVQHTTACSLLCSLIVDSRFRTSLRFRTVFAGDPGGLPITAVHRGSAWLLRGILQLIIHQMGGGRARIRPSNCTPANSIVQLSRLDEKSLCMPDLGH